MRIPKKLDKTVAEFLLKKVDNFLFDCDGVLWHAGKPIPGCPELVQKLIEMGKRVFYLTNNSSRTRDQLVEKCHRMGFPAHKDNIVGSAYTAAQYLNQIGFKDKLYVVGNPSMAYELDEFGIRHMGIGPDPVPTSACSFDDIEKTVMGWKPDPEVKGVLVGFDPHLSFMKMTVASSYAKNPDNHFLATNEDHFLPVLSDICIPGTGSIVASVKVPARREPLVVGKPQKTMFSILHDVHGLEAEKTVMVGDSLATDIAMAGNCDLHSLFVLTGADNMDMVEEYRKKGDDVHVPEYYADSLACLAQYMDS